ncbi:50S ribosomal protein L35 [Patescibacteria group bacterium]|nr:50S ribosomal protein L35 [Patescibacteria group bacterium]
MPKVKTHKGAAARIRLTASGKLKRRRAFTSHMLEHKSATNKRDKRGVTGVSEADNHRARKLLGKA